MINNNETRVELETNKLRKNRGDIEYGGGLLGNENFF